MRIRYHLRKEFANPTDMRFLKQLNTVNQAIAFYSELDLSLKEELR